MNLLKELPTSVEPATLDDVKEYLAEQGLVAVPVEYTPEDACIILKNSADLLGFDTEVESTMQEMCMMRDLLNGIIKAAQEQSDE